MKLIIFFLFSLNVIASEECPLNDGDLIFIKSQSSQAIFLKMATGSDWTHVGMIFKKDDSWQVIEAVEPVRWTPLNDFIARSKDSIFSVKRVDQKLDTEKIREQAETFLGKHYDILFQWDNERIYCSELVWKSYFRSQNLKIGKLRKMSEYQIDNPRLWIEVIRRHKILGAPFNKEKFLQSTVVGPYDMYESPLLVEVTSQKKDLTTKHCFKSSVAE